MGDKRSYKARKRDAERDQNGKTRYEMVRDGDIEPQGKEKGWLNITPLRFDTMDEDRARAIRSKGGKASQEIRGEKKTARQVMENLLSLKATDAVIESADISAEMADRLRKGAKDATLYDVVGAVALGKALDGNVKAMEFIRDTRGDAPIKEMRFESDIMTDADRVLLQEIAKRLEDKEIVVVKDIGSDGK